MAMILPSRTEIEYAENLRNRVQEQLMRCQGLLNHYSNPLPEVTYTVRGKVAGLAYYQENRIDLNAQLLIENTEDMINDTVPHEYAHLVSYQRYGSEGAGHKYLWKKVMWELGLEPTRCHQYETTPARQTQKFKYECACAKGYCELGATRHKRTQRRTNTYYCTKCNTTLTTLLPIERW